MRQNSHNPPTPGDCPTDGKCLTQSVVYQADVTTHDNQEKKIYVGVTANEFKDRYQNHIKSFRNEKYSCDTGLSKYIWKLKTAKRNFDIKWSLIKRVPAYKVGSKRCNLCLEEKLILMKGRKKNFLNRRCELFSKCRHVTKNHLN